MVARASLMPRSVKWLQLRVQLIILGYEYVLPRLGERPRNACILLESTVQFVFSINRRLLFSVCERPTCVSPSMYVPSDSEDGTYSVRRLEVRSD
uniref:Secreted protein n=1 Tax=Angiostrongylus cantonensis TaxID=6313 RepID=A0A0K0DNR5_ANGCA